MYASTLPLDQRASAEGYFKNHSLHVCQGVGSAGRRTDTLPP